MGMPSCWFLSPARHVLLTDIESSAPRLRLHFSMVELSCGTKASRIRLQVSGARDAPVGRPTIGFMYMVGEKELRAWDAVEAEAAVAAFSTIVHRRLQRAGGYLVGWGSDEWAARFMG
jgi:hypothetical protein